MKKMLLFILLVVCTTGYAQNGVYLLPGFGFGETNVKTSIDYLSKSSIFHYNVQMGIGYQKNRWRMESGVRYFTTGFKNKEFYVFENNVVQFIWAGGGINTLVFTHLSVPLAIGYQVNLGKRLFLVPMVGIAGSYNINAHIKTENEFTGQPVDSRYFSAKEFDAEYRRYSAWLTGKLSLEYKATKRTNFLLGFQSDYMLTSMFAPHSYFSNFTQNNYAFSFNIGMKWDIRSQRNYQ